MPRKFDFAKECKKESKALLAELKKIALNPSLRKPSVKLSAINQMLDRAYGKPRETVDVKQGPRIIEVIHAPASTLNPRGQGINQDKKAPEIGNSGVVSGQDMGQSAGNGQETVQ